MAAPQPVGVPGKFAAGIRKLCRDAIGKAFKAAGSKMKLAGCIFAVLVGIVGVLRLLRGPAAKLEPAPRRGRKRNQRFLDPRLEGVPLTGVTVEALETIVADPRVQKEWSTNCVCNCFIKPETCPSGFKDLVELVNPEFEWFGHNSRRRDCHSAATPSTFSRCLNRDGEKERQQNDSLGQWLGHKYRNAPRMSSRATFPLERAHTPSCSSHAASDTRSAKPRHHPKPQLS